MFEMASLRVPFQGNSIQELYKKITRGIISKIPVIYSQEINSIIKLCLTKDQLKRPTVSELLEHPIIQSKVEMYGIKIEVSENAPGEVLGEIMGTIKLPRNLNLLIERLPQKRYSSERALSMDNTKETVPSNAFKKRPHE